MYCYGEIKSRSLSKLYWLIISEQTIITNKVSYINIKKEKYNKLNIQYKTFIKRGSDSYLKESKKNEN